MGNSRKADPYQNYNLTGVISNSTQTINGMTVTPGDLVLNGTVTNASGPSSPLTIVVTKANLASFAIYGANPAYTICGTCSDTNKVVEKAVADYFSGLNFGFIGSPAPNPNNPGHTIGDSPSWTWYGNQPNGGGPTPLPLSDAYAAAQPDNPGFYNAYAAYLNNSSAPVTDAYGFPYTDRLASPLAPLDDNTILTMTILPDTAASSAPAWVITVPSPNMETFSDLLVGPTPSSMLTVTGGGTAILSAENTYSGGTTITDGTTVQVTNSNPGVSSSIGTGGLTLDDGILQAGANDLTFNNPVSLTSNGGTFDSNGNTLTWSGVISGDGGLTKIGAGTLILASTNTYAGGTLLDFGTLGLAANGALGSGGVTMQPGTTLQFEASGIALENSIVLNANPTFDTGSNTDAISGVISGSGALTKIGSGTLILAGANTYAGGTLLDVGTLGIASNGALGAGALAMAARHDAAVRGERAHAPERDRAERRSDHRHRVEHGHDLGRHLKRRLPRQNRLGNADPDGREHLFGPNRRASGNAWPEGLPRFDRHGGIGRNPWRNGVDRRAHRQQRGDGGARRARALCEIHRHGRSLLRGRLDLRGQCQSDRPKRQARYFRNHDHLRGNGRGQRRERNLSSLDALHPSDRTRRRLRNLLLAFDERGPRDPRLYRSDAELRRR